MGGGYTTSVEYLSRGGGTPPQWNINPQGGGVHHLSGIFFPASHFPQCPIFHPFFFFWGGCSPVLHGLPFFPTFNFHDGFFRGGWLCWGRGSATLFLVPFRQEGRKGGGGYHTFIRLLLRCFLFYVLDTRCQIRLQTSDFIHIAAPFKTFLQNRFRGWCVRNAHMTTRAMAHILEMYALNEGLKGVPRVGGISDRGTRDEGSSMSNRLCDVMCLLSCYVTCHAIQEVSWEVQLGSTCGSGHPPGSAICNMVLCSFCSYAFHKTPWPLHATMVRLDAISMRMSTRFAPLSML